MANKKALGVCLFAAFTFSIPAWSMSSKSDSGSDQMVEEMNGRSEYGKRLFAGARLGANLAARFNPLAQKYSTDKKKKVTFKLVDNDEIFCPEIPDVEPVTLVDLGPTRSAPRETGRELIGADDRYEIYSVSIEVGEKDKIALTYDLYKPTTYSIWGRDPGGLNMAKRVDKARSAFNEKTPMVFILPGISGSGFLDEVMASYLASSGISVVITHFFEEERSCKIEGTEQLAMRALRASMATVDSALTQDDVDQDRLALLGTSYGGIRGSYYMGIDNRIKSAVLIVAGGPLPDVMAYSEQQTMANIRNTQMRNAKITDRELYLETLSDSVSITLPELLEHRNPEDFLLYIAKKDDYVPTRYQYGLADIIKGKNAQGPIYREFNSGHLMTPFKVAMFHMADVYEFFLDRWEKQPFKKPAP